MTKAIFSGLVSKESVQKGVTKMEANLHGKLRCRKVNDIETNERKGERRTMVGFSLQAHCWIDLYLSATESGCYPLIVSGEQRQHGCTFYFNGNQLFLFLIMN